MTLAGKIAGATRHDWLSRAFLAAAAMTVLSYGSASTVATNLAALTFAVLAALTIGRPIVARPIARVQAIAIVVAAALLAYGAFQAFASSDFANAAWKSVADNLGPTSGSISVAPAMTRDALTALALPFLAFVAALALFQGDDEAILLWRALAYFGAAYAVFGVLQELLFPEQILIDAKRFYVGSLTATFINRNTAGTFFGLAFLLNFGLLFFYLRRIHAERFLKRAANFEIGWRDKYGLVLAHALVVVMTAVALFLTQSRGAVGATFLAVIFASMLMLGRKLTADERGEAGWRWRKYAAPVGVVVATIAFFALFAGRSTYRMAEQGGDDARWCAFGSTINAIKDNWLWGTGFGAFQDVFSVYRNEACVGIYGVWERAHNVFLEGYLGLGLAFAIVAVLGYCVLLRAFVIGIRTRHRLRYAPVMGLAALLLVSVHSIVDFSVQVPGCGVYFAAILAAAVAVSLGRASTIRPLA